MPEIIEGHVGLPAKCYDCLSTDIAMKVIGLPGGAALYFCARCWEEEEQFRNAVRSLTGLDL